MIYRLLMIFFKLYEMNHACSTYFKFLNTTILMSFVNVHIMISYISTHFIPLR